MRDAVVPIVAVLVVCLSFIVIHKTVPTERRRMVDDVFTAACSGALMALNSFLLTDAGAPKAAVIGLATGMLALHIRLLARRRRVRGF